MLAAATAHWVTQTAFRAAAGGGLRRERAISSAYQVSEERPRPSPLEACRAKEHEGARLHLLQKPAQLADGKIERAGYPQGLRPAHRCSMRRPAASQECARSLR